MKIFASLLLSVLIIACQPKEGPVGGATTTVTTTAPSSSTVAPAAAPPQTSVPAPGTARVNRNARLRTLPKDAKSTGPKLIVRVGEATAATGEKACVPVEVTDLKQLVGFQYTMAFDSAALEFVGIEKVNLPGYGSDNFGTRFADRGVVSTLWTDLSLKGVTRPANHPLYEICFKNLMPSGQQTPVRLQDGPTAFEVVRADMQTPRLVWADGTVYSR